MTGGVLSNTVVISATVWNVFGWFPEVAVIVV